MNSAIGRWFKAGALLFVTTLIVAACEGAVGKPGLPGEPGDPAKQPPYVVLALPDLPALVQGMSDTVDLSTAFGDPDGETLTLDARSTDRAIATAAVSDTTLTVTGVGVGTTSVVVTATDADDLKVSQSFQVTVTAAPPTPEPPVTIGDVPATLTITPTTADDVSKEVELPADHSLRSGNTDVVTVAKKTADASTPASSIRWASATADTAEKNVWVVTAVSEGVASVYVLDASKAIAKTIAVSVTADPPDPAPEPVAPTQTADIPDQTLYKDDGAQTIDLSTYFTHANAITYAASVSPEGFVTVAVSDGGTLTLTPRVTGQTIVTVTATADGESVTEEFTVNVVAGSKPVPPAPVAPTKTDIPDQTLYKDDGAHPIDLAMHFTHANAITYAVSSSPSGIVSTEEVAGTLTLIPLVRGETIVTVVATADGESATDTFTVEVVRGSEPDPAPEPMDPVTVGTIADTTLKVGGDADTVDVAGNFSDEDSETLTYSAESDKEDVATASAVGSMVTVTPVGAGSATITVTAQDEGGRTATQTFMVTVNKADPKSPVSQGRINNVTMMLGDADKTVDVAGNFSDEDSETLTYSAESNATAVATVSVSGSTVTVTPVGVGSATITVTAKDEGDRTATQQFTVTVNYVSSITMDVGGTEDITVEAGYDVQSSAPGIADAVRKDSTTFTVTAYGKGKVDLEVSENYVIKRTISVTVKNRAPTVVSTHSNEVLDLENLDETTAVTLTTAERKALGRLEAELYKVDWNNNNLVSLASLFNDPDGDTPLTYTVRSSRPNHAIVIGLEEDGTEVYVEVLDNAIDIFEIIVEATDDDTDNPLTSPSVALKVRLGKTAATGNPKAQTHTVKQENNNIASLVDNKKVSFRKDVKDTFTFTGGVQFFNLIEANKDITVDVGKPSSDSARTDYVTIETSDGISFATTDLARSGDDTTLQVTLKKSGNAWIKINYHKYDGANDAEGDNRKWKIAEHRTLRFNVMKPVENPVTLAP